MDYDKDLENNQDKDGKILAATPNTQMDNEFLISDHVSLFSSKQEL